MDLKATMTKIEAAVEKRAEALAEAAGDDLKRLEEEIVGLLDFGHAIQQHPAVTGAAAPAEAPAAPAATVEPAPEAQPETPTVEPAPTDPPA